jgi:hypothetical protein
MPIFFYVIGSLGQLPPGSVKVLCDLARSLNMGTLLSQRDKG